MRTQGQGIDGNRGRDHHEQRRLMWEGRGERGKRGRVVIDMIERGDRKAREKRRKRKSKEERVREREGEGETESRLKATESKDRGNRSWNRIWSWKEASEFSTNSGFPRRFHLLLAFPSLPSFPFVFCGFCQD